MGGERERERDLIHLANAQLFMSSRGVSHRLPCMCVMHTYTHTYIRTYTHAYTHTDTYRHTDMHACISALLLPVSSRRRAFRFACWPAKEQGVYTGVGA
jgi:hypothetical protein